MQELLVIDDDDLIRRALVALLADAYRVHAFRDAAGALNFLRGGSRPFAILVDASMPGMSGFEFRAHQKQDAAIAHIPVILMTGSDIIPPPMIADFRAIIAKPFSADDLVPVLREIAGSPGGHVRK